MRDYLMITGAAGGLGRSFAVEAAGRGWNLVLTDRPGTALDELARALGRSYGVAVRPFYCELEDQADRAALFERIRRGEYAAVGEGDCGDSSVPDHRMSTIEVAPTEGTSPGRAARGDVPGLAGIVNVAGVDFEGTFDELRPEEARSIVRVNVEATLDLTRRALDCRRPGSRFFVISVSSLAAFYPMPVKATYAASKRFLLDFFRALREELRGSGTSVTVLCPAGLPTTEGAIRGIELQGFWGRATSVDPARAARSAFATAERGRFLCIPGLINRVLRLAGSLLPASAVAAVVARRWKGNRRAAAVRTGRAA